MRRVKPLNILIFATLCIVALSGAYFFSHSDAVAADTPAAAKGAGEDFFMNDFSFKNNTGKTYHMYDFKNKKVIVHMWATWCPPCVAEFPDLLQRMAKSPDITLIAMSSDQSQEDMDNFLKTLKVPTKLPNVIYVWDKDSVLTEQVFSVSAYPETFVFNKGLKLIMHAEGAVDWESLDTK